MSHQRVQKAYLPRTQKVMEDSVDKDIAPAGGDNDSRRGQT